MKTNGGETVVIYVKKYPFCIEELRGLTILEAERAFQIAPDPPKVDDINDYIVMAACGDENGFLFFMHAYGPEQRGGSAKCTVILSDDEIISPLPCKSDGLIAMNDSSFKKFAKDLKSGGIMIINANRVVSKNKRDDIKLLPIPADDLAHELGSDKIANIVLIGAMIGYSDMLDLEILMRSLEKKFRAKGDAIVELNRRALYKGVELGRAAK